MKNISGWANLHFLLKKSMKTQMKEYICIKT